nr:F-box domain-containing protein [Cedratvirus lena]
MNYLPPETKEQILLSLREPKDICQACSTSRDYYAICSEEGFWKRKFRRERMQPLETGKDFADWLRIYEKSLDSVRIANKLIDSGKKIIIDMALVTNPRVLLLFKSDTEMMDFWYYAEKKEKKEGINTYIYYISIVPHHEPGLYVCYLRYDVSQIDGNYSSVVPVSVVLGAVLTKRDLQVLLYRLAYFGYPF